METNNYQDLTALLATLSSYTAPQAASVEQQVDHAQGLPSQDPNLALAALLGGQYHSLPQGHTTPFNHAEYAYPQQYNHVDDINDHHKLNSAPAIQQYNRIPLAHDQTQYQAHLNQPYDPSKVHNQPHPPALNHELPRTYTPPPPPKPRPPQSNPRTIITWPAAIRHVTFLATQHEHLAASIRKLIANQHENERQWHASRVALLEKQKARVAGKRELDDVLRSVGAFSSMKSSGSSNGSSNGDASTDLQELQLYDRKVHRAAVQMSRAMSADLETLGVPFFGIEPGLVVDDADDDGPGARKRKQLQKDDVVEQDRRGKISKSELRLLQRRMIRHLEDMYKD